MNYIVTDNFMYSVYGLLYALIYLPLFYGPTGTQYLRDQHFSCLLVKDISFVGDLDFIQQFKTVESFAG